MKKPLLVIIILAAFGGFLTYKMLHLAEIQCSLCIEFNGKRQCSEAMGPTEDEARTEAHRNACAVLASGVTEVVACNRAEEQDIICQQAEMESPEESE